MRNQLPALAPVVLACTFFAFASAATGQELIRNGRFEEGRLPPWNVHTVPGSTVKLTAENSPFGSGQSLVRLDDDDSDFEQPSLTQSFPAQRAITFGFDFKLLGGEDGSPWYVAWVGDTNTTAFFFSLGGVDGLSLELNQEGITTLKTNVWYQIEGLADATQQSVRGVVKEEGGGQSVFQSGFPFGVKDSLNAVEVSDGDAARNYPVLLDNFSAGAISLQITPGPEGVMLQWPTKEFRLQSATEIASTNWTDVISGVQAYTNAISDRLRFFRLAR